MKEIERRKKMMKGGGVIERKLCAMKGGRGKIIPAAGVKVNREVGQEPGRPRRLKMFFFSPFMKATAPDIKYLSVRVAALDDDVWRSLNEKICFMYSFRVSKRCTSVCESQLIS